MELKLVHQVVRRILKVKMMGSQNVKKRLEILRLKMRKCDSDDQNDDEDNESLDEDSVSGRDENE